jgi:ectoine hydroxylase
MELSEKQLAEYRNRGYLFFPSLLSSSEADILRNALPDLMASTGPEVKRDNPEDVPKIIYAPHATDERYKAAARLPRILGIVEQLLGEQAYVYQSRVNLKLPFTRDAWSWHQDFTAWHRGDGMPRPHAMMVAVFIDACTPANGPLLVMPSSHSEDLDEILGREAEVVGYDVQRMETDVLRQYADRGGIADLAGPAGSVAFIHPTLLHGSAANMSPWPRSILYINYSAVTNRTVANKRPWFMNNTDATPLAVCADNTLIESTAGAPQAS